MPISPERPLAWARTLVPASPGKPGNIAESPETLDWSRYGIVEIDGADAPAHLAAPVGSGRPAVDGRPPGATMAGRNVTSTEPTMSDLTRRHFVKLLGVCAASCPLLIDGCGPMSGPLPAGNVSGAPPGSLRAIVGQGVILGHDGHGLYAMSSICTHLGCDMSQTGQIGPSGCFCGCHGSEYDTDGNVVRGPSVTPLPHYAVAVDSSGAITIDPTTTVPESQRTPA
ncbi:MAG: Rieske (2Fe-2S) protein [Deltaproteobacteria bacterium]